MKVYNVTGIVDMEVTPGNFVEVNMFYGVFSSQLKAGEIANKLRKHISENNGKETIYVEELVLDEPTKDYYIEMEN